MKINLNQKFLDPKGGPLLERDKDKVGVLGEEREVFLRQACENACLSNHDSNKINGDEKNRRYKTWLKIAKSEEDIVNLDSKEITKLKDNIGAIYPPLIVGQAWEMLENGS